MAIDYLAESEKYRPRVIETLLVGEAPPPSKSSYFYVPTSLNSQRPIRGYRSLPATIFHHYFRRLPNDAADYEALLLDLKARGVFLVDILDVPIKVRNDPDGLARVVEAIPRLRGKLIQRDIALADECIVFLLARNNYRRHLRQAFPTSTMVSWLDFRLNGAVAGPQVL